MAVGKDGRTGSGRCSPPLPSPTMFWSWRPSRRDVAFSWLVATASFVSILLSIGLSFGSVGVLTVAFGEQFDTLKTEDLSWVGGMRISFIFLTGVFASALIKRFGARVIQLVGCAVAAVGVGVSPLMSELWQLYLTFGALAGIGMSLIFTAGSVVVEGHFDRFMHVALPLTQLGDTVGYCVFPASTQSLLNTIGLQNTMYLFCGFCGVPALCALLYAPDAQPRPEAPSTPPTPAEKTNGHAYAAVTDLGTAAPTPTPPPLQQLPNGTELDRVTLLEMRPMTDGSGGNDSPRPATTAEPKDERAAGGADPAALAGDYVDEAAATAVAIRPSPVATAERPAAAAPSLRADIKSLLTSRDAWIVFVNTFCWPYTSASIVVLLPSYIVRAGYINKDEAALGLTIVGLANVVGNVTTILAGMRPYNHALLYAIACAAFGASSMLYVVSNESVAAYYSLCAFNGFWLGMILGLVVSIMYDYSGDASFTSMFGFSTFATGLGDLAGAGVTGIIQTHAGDDVGLYVSGAFSLLACVSILPLAIRTQRQPARTTPV